MLDMHLWILKSQLGIREGSAAEDLAHRVDLGRTFP